MSPLVSILTMLAVLMGASSGVAVRPQPSASANVPMSVSPVVSTNIDIVSDSFLPEQTQENVLVVPTPDLPAENQAELTADLSIMCRIFDKSVPAAGSNVSFAYGDRADSLRWVIAQQGRGTQGLYLDGYGTLFFIRVDYPLAPTQVQEAGQAKPKEPVDSVWDQTVREMSGQPGDEPQSARNAPAYDAQRVENLKKTLVKTLAHASNIRMRRPQDVVTLVIGALDDSRALSYRRYGAAGRPATTAAAPMPPGASKAQPTVRNPAAALLVMRVAKADVDAFAKGQLTAAQFTEKVQILWSAFSQGTPATAPAPATPTKR